MKTRLRNLWEWLRQSLWLVPALCIGAAAALAAAMIQLDDAMGEASDDGFFLYKSGADASLALAGAITSSLITVAGVTFSITVVTLTLASSQFGPRLLRSFLRSFPSQFTLGALVGAFVYGLLVMRSVGPDWEEGNAHPSMSVMILLATLCVGLLIYFIHHVAVSIQADTLIAGVYREFEDAIDALEDFELPSPEQGYVPQPEPAGERHPLVAWKSGYILAFDRKGLAEWARRHGCLAIVDARAGSFVARGSRFAKIEFPPGQRMDEPALCELKRYIYLGEKRTPEQDFEFLADQLVEMAMRALSPGINDPNTALICLDFLAAALVQLSRKRFPPPLQRDEDGQPRAWIPYTDFEGVANNCFDRIRQQSSGHPSVLIRAGESLERVARCLPRGSGRARVLAIQARQLREHAKQENLTSKDREDVERALGQCERAIAEAAA